MKKRIILTFVTIVLVTLQSFAQASTKTGGIGGQAIFDTVLKNPIIKSLEITKYLNARSLRPGDLILEIDKIPVHQMSYGQVLGLVQGTVGTPVSLKVLRYNGIEKYYEVKRVRVTLDMKPTWWQVPDYKYYSTITEGINYSISQLKENIYNSIDSVAKIIGSKDKFYSNYNIRGAYEAIYTKSPVGNFSWNCNFVKTKDKTKAETLYNDLITQLKDYTLTNAELVKSENNQPETKDYNIKIQQASDASLSNLNIDVRLKKEFDKDENAELWKVEMIVRI